MPEPTGDQVVTCSCGKVALALSGPPILTAECFCDSCRQAGRILGELPGAVPLLDSRGGTRAVMQRKDQVRCLQGGELLREFRLKPDSKTRRVVAGCCNAAMLLDFTRGHWLDVYASRWPDGRGPQPEMRTMTGDLPPGTRLPPDIPNLKAHSGRFFVRLLGAWIAMRFRRPAIDWIKGAPMISDDHATNSDPDRMPAAAGA